MFQGRLDTIAYFIERFFIENKFMGLFSLLFGISFWLFLSRVERQRCGGDCLFYRRIFWLFVIGAIHGWLLWCFDILRFYALWAVLLPLFVRTRRGALGIALSTGVLLPALVAAANAGLTHPVTATTDYDAMALAAFSRRELPRGPEGELAVRLVPDPLHRSDCISGGHLRAPPSRALRGPDTRPGEPWRASHPLRQVLFVGGSLASLEAASSPGSFSTGAPRIRGWCSVGG